MTEQELGPYEVTKADDENKTVEYKASANDQKTVVISDTVNINGVEYKVTSIAKNAFENNDKITKVTIGNNITTIGENAFSGCSKLKTIVIGKKVTSIGENAFYGCKKVTKRLTNSVQGHLRPPVLNECIARI